MIIVASDNGISNFKTSTSTLSVTIKDVNDNVPLFEQSFYEANLSEDESDGKCFLTVTSACITFNFKWLLHLLGKSITSKGNIFIFYTLQIKASDRDCGANGTILYSIEKANTDIFEINSSSGKLCLKNSGQGN